MQTFLAVISVLLIISVFLSLIKNDFWIYKIFEYPRIQKLALIIIVSCSWLIYWPLTDPVFQVIMAALCVSMLYLFYKIWPYTMFYKVEMIRAKQSKSENELKIFSANVLQDNTKFAAMLDQIRSTDPDIVFLLETNAAWAKEMKELEKEYPFTLLAPQENTYGLLFYSRLKLTDGKINFLVKDDLPSIEGIIHLKSGQQVKFWGLHPEPPVPGESLYSTAKDKELMKIALTAKDCKLPAIVFGDLNDVAWSHTTELFRKTSGMLDPRRGRGFYNTFSAHHWFIRFPLDYIFCSKEFALINMKRMPKNGSDHYAMFIQLTHEKQNASKQSAPAADKEEIDEAKKMAAQPA